MMNRILKLASICAAGIFVNGCGDPNPTAKADLNKVLRVAFQIAESGFDPQALSERYGADVMRNIFEPPYQVDYLARPVRFTPQAAEAMPEITDGGKTYTIKLRKGIYYADDPAFGGKKRELVAEDYVFGIKRVFDPKILSPRLTDYLEFGIIGAEEFYRSAKDKGWNPDLPIEGLKAIDKYTLQFKIKKPDPQLLSWLAYYPSSPVAREVWEKYKDSSNKINNNPVGTGPYYLKEWKRNTKTVLEANPYFRGVKFPESSADPADQVLIEQMKGKTLPAIGRIEISIIEESNPRLLAFKGRNIDQVDVPTDLVDNVFPAMKLSPDMAAAKADWQRTLQPALSYMYFNIEDPMLGGLTKERIALRRALIMAFDTDDYIRLVWKGHALPAAQMIPPPMLGYDSSVKNVSKFDMDAAKKLLDKFGYVDKDGDGWRDQPDGKPLVVTFASTPTARDREIDEFWKRSLDGLKVKSDFFKQKWPDLLKMAKAKQLQTWTVGWFASLPDGLTFPKLLYSPMIGQANYSNFKSEEFDKVFEQARFMEDSPERTKLMLKMDEIAKSYSVWENGVYRFENTLTHPWVLGYKKHPFMNTPWWMYDIDTTKLPKS
jgi:oligopeptide transport system substrate-binding protein